MNALQVLTTLTTRPSAPDATDRAREDRRADLKQSADMSGRITAAVKAITMVAVHRMLLTSTAHPRRTRRKYPSRHDLLEPSRMECEMHRL